MATADPARQSAIVAIAAEPREFDGLLRHASTAPSLVSADSDLFLRRAEIDGRPWLLAAGGPGPRLARQTALAALKLSDARVLVSTGFCGALDPALSISDVFVATEVRTGAVVFPAESPQNPGRFRKGPLHSADTVASTVRQKQELKRAGASVVEMEAAAVAGVARERGLPFFCVRVVSDDARTPMPLDFNLFRDAAGRFDRRRIARAAALRPWVWPALIRLDRACRSASLSLGDFLAACRF